MDVHEAGILDNKTLGQPTGLTRDEVFYFQNVTFQVGKTLFRVPRNIFNVPGTVFEAMFTLPPVADVDAEGSSDWNPIELKVDEDYFRAFLRVVCGPRGRNIPDEDWLMALDLATLWIFDDIRRLAIQSLDGWVKSQSLKHIVLTAKKYNIGSWLKFAYTRLAWQDPVPFDTLIEPPAVDWETIARLLYAQKWILPRRQSSTFGSSPRCLQCSTGMLCCGNTENSILVIFKAEFESMTETPPVVPTLPGLDSAGIPKGKKGKKKK